MSVPLITDICRRVLGDKVTVNAMQDEQRVWQVVVAGTKPTDPLTLSQQEMDIIMSLQHGLQGAAVRLMID